MSKTSRYSGQSRESGTFVALPHAVIDSKAYRGLSVHARAFLIDVARQFSGFNNGSLLASRAQMAPLGWKSNDMLTKCTKELIEAKLLHMTVMGRRPNRAAWFAVTWQKLDKLDGYDPGAAESFVRGAYRMGEALPVKPTREQLFRKWDRPAKTQSLDRLAGQETPA